MHFCAFVITQESVERLGHTLCRAYSKQSSLKSESVKAFIPRHDGRFQRIAAFSRLSRNAPVIKNVANDLMNCGGTANLGGDEPKHISTARGSAIASSAGPSRPGTLLTLSNVSIIVTQTCAACP